MFKHFIDELWNRWAKFGFDCSHLIIDCASQVLARIDPMPAADLKSSRETAIKLGREALAITSVSQ
jgi:hypothetical protein